MAYGLQTFDADGNVLVDVSTQLTRLLYERWIPQYTSGMVTVPGFNNNGGEAWTALVYPPAVGGLFFGSGVPMEQPPTVSVAGDDIYWTNSGRPGDSYLYVMMWGQS